MEFALSGPQGGVEKVGPLPIVPGPVIAADGMMMRDGAARHNQRVAGRILDGLPLLEQRAVTAERVEGKIRCGPVRIDMGEAAGYLAFDAGRFQDGTLGRRFHAVMKA